MGESKQQILLEAIRILAREGYGKLSMHALAGAGGMKPGFPLSITSALGKTC